MDRAGDAVAIRGKTFFFSSSCYRPYTWLTTFRNWKRVIFWFIGSFKKALKLCSYLIVCLPLCLSGLRGLQRRLEQSVRARGLQDAGRMYPSLPSSADRGPLPGRLFGFSGPSGVSARAFQPVREPRYEHCGLPGVCSGSSSGVCCS